MPAFPLHFHRSKIYFHISEVQTSVHRERKSVHLWKYTSQINVQRKCADLQFIAAVGHIAVCTIQAEDLVTIFFRLLVYAKLQTHNVGTLTNSHSWRCYVQPSRDT